MNCVSRLALAISILVAGSAAASAASISGSGALALAAVVASHSTELSPAEKKEVAAIFDGKGEGSYKGKITVAADKVTCRSSNVDITARSCELSFGTKTQTFSGREANELYATEAMAGVPSDGAAGTIYEGLANLKCTLDPQAIKQNDGGGAECSYDPPN
jgi:hypothetical protein